MAQKELFLLSKTSGPAVGPAQPPVQWLKRASSPLVKRPGLKLTTHLRLAPRSRTSGALSPLHHTPSRPVWNNFTFYIFTLHYSGGKSLFNSRKYLHVSTKISSLNDRRSARNYYKNPPSAFSSQAIVHPALGTTDSNPTIFSPQLFRLNGVFRAAFCSLHFMLLRTRSHNCPPRTQRVILYHFYCLDKH
jgi:hypothetical protein